MSLFKLLVTRDGLILTTDQAVSQRAAHEIRQAFKAWQADNTGRALFLQETEIVEIDLPVSLELSEIKPFARDFDNPGSWVIPQSVADEMGLR